MYILIYTFFNQFFTSYCVFRFPASPIGSPTSEVAVTSTTSVIPVIPAPSSSSSASNAGVCPPRGSGKPLAMMVELANKTKMASEQASAKAPGTAKSSFSWSKTKGSSNGIEDSASQKKVHERLCLHPGIIITCSLISPPNGCFGGCIIYLTVSYQ